MLILTDREGERQVTPEDLLKKINFPIGKIRKSRSFSLNPNFQAEDLGMSDYQRRRVTKKPAGITYPSFFTFKDSEGYDCSLRYCSQVPHKTTKGGEVVNVYTPRNIRIEGEGSAISVFDQAVFLYLYPVNKQSPYRKSSYYLWLYDDIEEIADEQLKTVDVLLESLNHASNLSVQDLFIFAKGVGVGTEGMSEKSVRTSLLMMAKNNPVDYDRKRHRALTTYEGLIQDCIDKSVFVLVDRNGMRFWTWSEGTHAGAQIVAIEQSGISPNELLKNFLKDPDRIAYYTEEMKKQVTRKNIDSTAESVLQELKAVEPLSDTVSSKNVYIPSKFMEAEEYLKKRHSENLNPSKSQVSQFFKKIESGEINSSNIEDEALNYIRGASL